MRLVCRSRSSAAGLSLAALLVSLAAHAQTPLFTDGHTIATADVAAPVEETFTTTAAGTYKVTLTDLGVAQGMPLTSVKMIVTQGSTIVATLNGLNGGSTGTVSVAAAASTAYTLHVVGTPAAGSSTAPIGEAIQDPSGATLASYVDALTIPRPASNGQTVLTDTFTPATTATYTFAVTDLQLPKALKTVDAAITPSGGGAPVATLPLMGGATQTTVSLTGGTTYTIVAIGAADPNDTTAVGGLFTVTVTSGGVSAYAKAITVGSITQLAQSPMALAVGGYTLSVADLGFPLPLSQGAAVVVRDDGTVAAGPVAAGASLAFNVATAGNYLAFAVATAQAAAPGAGSYAVVVKQQSGSAPPALSVARGVTTANSSLAAYNFDTSVSTAGNYAATLTDFKFPDPGGLTVAELAAAQAGALLGTPITSPGNFTFNNAAQGPMTLIAFAQAGTAGGLLGIDVNPSAGGAPIYEITQGVGAAFKATKLTVNAMQPLNVTATDLVFPAALGTFNVAVTQGTTKVGSILSAGASATFPIQATPGTYWLNVVAQPSGTDKAGTYYVSVAAPPPAPVVNLSADSTAIATGGTVKLTWSTQNAQTCTASGGSGWTGSKDPGGGNTQTSALSTDTTFSLSCTGDGGTVSKSVTVTITSQSTTGNGGGTKSSGGGAIDLWLICALGLLLAGRLSLTSRRPLN
jgi:hypothetical protein